MLTLTRKDVIENVALNWGLLKDGEIWTCRNGGEWGLQMSPRNMLQGSEDELSH